MTGRTISHYKIIDKLGEGGMGIVYKAHDTKLDRIVALKFLPAHLGVDETEKQRFLREARAASSLDHSNICSIYSIEETEDGGLFITMAFYEGMSLTQRIGNGPLPIKDVLNFSVQIASGLQKAHEKGIVHRDLKPSNILITNDNQVKIIDFGLAKAIEHTALTKAGSTLGTVPYMSPEQAQGHTVDHRTDIWSLGIIMYEMITGQHPFRSEYETALIYSIINQEPDPVTGLRSGIPMDLERIIQKCLEKEAGNRYQSTSEIIVDLQRVERDLTSSAHSKFIKPDSSSVKSSAPDFHPGISPQEKESPRYTGAPKKLSNLLFVSGILILVFIISIYYFSRRMDPSSGSVGQITLRQITFASGVDEYPVWSPDGTAIAFSREIHGYRNIFIKDIQSGNERQITHTEADNTQPAWAPDAKSLLFVRANQATGKIGLSDLFGYYTDGDIWKMDLETMTEQKFIENAFNPAFSPDGKWIAVDASWAGPRRLWLVDERGRNPRQISSDVSEAVEHTAPKFSADGSRLVFQHIEGTRRDIRMLNRQTEEITLITDDHFLNILPFWSPSGDMIYFSSYRGGGINIWRTQLGRDNFSLPGRYEQITTGAGQDLHVSISPDGGKIAFSVLGLNSNIWLLPVSPHSGLPNGEPQPLIVTTREDSRGAWSPDGKLIAFSSDRTGDMNIWIYSFDDGSVRQVTKGPGGDYQPNWSPDGKSIAFFSSRGGTLDIWSVEVGTGMMKQLTNRPASDINPFYSPDGKYIAFHSDEKGRLEPWVISSDGSEMRQLTSMPAGLHFMRWTKDGKSVIFRSPTSPKPSLWTVPVTGEEAKFLIDPPGTAHISLSPDHTLIMDVVNHMVLWAAPLDGSEPYKVFEFDDPEVRIDYPVWSPDGRYILFDHLRPSGGNIWIAEGL
jgi:eukaryotic-like serine/threonine-protein kinase